MGVSKRARFEVLRRDDYTCRYCRSKDGPLTVDHVQPVALGGSDDPSNLVAACRDCNAGKASTNLDAETAAQVADDALRWSRAIQAASRQRAQKAEAEADLIDWFVEAWESSMPPFATLPDYAEVEPTILRFFGLGLPVEEIAAAIDLTAGATHVYQRARWKYFCGVCWNKVRDLQDAARALIDSGEVT